MHWQSTPCHRSTSDKGKEFINHDFEAVLVEHGIKHYCVYPRSPWENGDDGRLNDIGQRLKKRQSL
jgi:IS30 family transposase